MSLRRILLSFGAGFLAAVVVALAVTAALSLTPAGELAGTRLRLGPLNLLSVSAEGDTTVAKLGPGALVVAAGLGLANTAAAVLVERRRQALSVTRP